MTDTAVALDTADAVELAEILEFFCDWFDYDRARLDVSLWHFTAGGYYTVANLRDDCRRFVDELGTTSVPPNSGAAAQ